MSELRVTVHPKSYHIKISDNDKKNMDDYLSKDCPQFIFLAGFKANSITNYNINDLNVEKFYTQGTTGYVSEEEILKIKNKLPEKIDKVLFAGQSTSLEKNGECLDGIIQVFEELLDKNIPFELPGYLIGDVSGFDLRNTEPMNIQDNYNTTRKITLV